mmetsp:Transcript_31790/g.87499  ORF Transcript_31790/g.87499 Transcript_31790/m.87499 type:complete len:160 (-) Transcript_31790:60-539(-)
MQAPLALGSRCIRRATTGDMLPVEACEGSSIAALRAEVAAAVGVLPSRVSLLDGRRILEDGDTISSPTAGALQPIVAIVKTATLREELEAWAKEWCAPRDSSSESWQEFQGMVGELAVNEDEGIATMEFHYLECTPVESNLDIGRLIYDMRAERMREVR